MKLRKSCLPFVVAFSIASLPSGPASAARTYKLTPATLRTMLVHSNLPIMIELNQVHQAKDQVSIARGNLLPRLNLGASLGALTGGPAFALSAVTFLLPFLVPSNWANLHQSEHLLSAEKESYLLLELNQYASAYTVYTTVLGDIGLRGVLVQQYNDLIGIRDWLINQKKFIGTVPQSDIDNADAQAKLAYASISAIDELLVTEKAALRQMLALGLSDNIVIEPNHVPASPTESMALAKVVSKVQSIAPENAQISFLYQAAQDVRWSKVFGFMSSAGLNVAQGSGISTAFSNMAVGTNFSIGFDYVPNIQLANDNMLQIQLRARELRLQEQQVVEATLGSVSEAKKQIDATSIAETELVSVYQAEFRKYTLGLSDLLHVLDAETKISQASAARVKAQIDLDTLRITLHRELLSDQFNYIPGCAIRPAADASDRAFWGNIFHWGSNNLSIDQVCRPAN